MRFVPRLWLVVAPPKHLVPKHAISSAYPGPTKRLVFHTGNVTTRYNNIRMEQGT